MHEHKNLQFLDCPPEVGSKREEIPIDSNVKMPNAGALGLETTKRDGICLTTAKEAALQCVQQSHYQG